MRETEWGTIIDKRLLPEWLDRLCKVEEANKKNDVKFKQISSQLQQLRKRLEKKEMEEEKPEKKVTQNARKEMDTGSNKKTRSSAQSASCKRGRENPSSKTRKG